MTNDKQSKDFDRNKTKHDGKPTKKAGREQISKEGIKDELKKFKKDR